ncbi:MAG: heavy metal-associated domain-containing protein, partial [Lachnospiraceae bacterium]|nr:heavy metal-associated domain-containing protein [Lachnospiraceae bacterium]
MMKSEIAKQLKISGMVCSGCEINIEKKVGSIPGVKKVKASYKNGTANVIYDESKVKLSEIKRQIEEMEYQVIGVGFDQKEYEKINYSQLFLILVILTGAFIIIDRLGGFTLFNFFPEAKE